MKPIVRWAIGIPVMMSAAGLFTLVDIFPFHPKTAVGWILLFSLSPLLMLLGESLGRLAFDRKFLTDWPGPARILYDVVVLGVVCSILAWLLLLFEPFLDKW